MSATVILIPLAEHFSKHLDSTDSGAMHDAIPVIAAVRRPNPAPWVAPAIAIFGAAGAALLAWRRRPGHMNGLADGALARWRHKKSAESLTPFAGEETQKLTMRLPPFDPKARERNGTVNLAASYVDETHTVVILARRRPSSVDDLSQSGTRPTAGLLLEDAARRWAAPPGVRSPVLQIVPESDASAGRR